MAYAKLAVVHHNRVSLDKRDEFAKRALALVDRLTTRERYYIEGFYYSLRPETVGRGIEAYQQGLKLHPEHQASRHNLGLRYMLLERYPEGIAHFEELLRRGTSNPTSYETLSGMLIETGNVGRAREITDDFVRRYPESSVAMRMLGTTLIAEKRFDEARSAFERSEALDPVDFTARGWQRAVAILQERWDDAGAVSNEMARSAVPFERFQGFVGEAFVASARGKGQVVADSMDRGARVAGLAAGPRAAVRNRLAQALLVQGKFEAALAQTQLALVDARSRDNEFMTLQLMAVAQAGTGRQADAAQTLTLLESRARMLPSQREIRRVHWARGEIALLQGETALAVAELTRASGMLPAHGLPGGPPILHGHLWHAAALAHLKAGRDSEAAQFLERLQAGEERVQAMDAWSRSFYLLGQIYERRGDAARARDQYGRFLNLWRDGDLERGWVAEAQKEVGG
ncbi:MAG: tetratricopeptide repeat protein [Acidobacteriota bacterium]|nr:tetratricopeptide repeat protein [Acidobacteriota bacterium]